jgi:SAM-dependent methyltransferase
MAKVNEQYFSKFREIWEKKTVLRKLYYNWYGKIIDNLSAGSNNIELGCGCGNFKTFFPDIIATDICQSPYTDKVADANNLNFPTDSVDNLVLIDVLHHLEKPLDFFEKSEKILRKGGRMIMLEPYISLFGYIVYKYFHHEPLSLNSDILDKNSDTTSVNEATATIIFRKQKERFKKSFKKLTIKKIEYFSFLLYPLSGGFSMPSLIPASWYPVLHRIEKFLTEPFIKILGLRMLIVIEKI